LTDRALVATRIHKLDQAPLAEFAATLHTEEHAEANRFRLDADRRRFIVGRGLLRSILAEKTGKAAGQLTFRRDAYGKLVSADAGSLAFNVSHSGNLVAVAVGAVRALGIDVEEMRHDLDLPALARHIFTPLEMRTLVDAPPALRAEIFFRSWVCKEALVKGLGTGLSREPKRFEVAFDRPEPAIRALGAAGDDIEPDWSLEILAVPAGYAGALAVLK
jgi:4'-phosphopantetheinyl transferase